MNRINTGNLGEKVATAYLVKKGYEIIEKNCRLRFAEIDIVVRKDGELVFIEVKSIRVGSSGPTNSARPDKQGRSAGWNPEDQLTNKKRLSMQRAALYY